MGFINLQQLVRNIVFSVKQYHCAFVGSKTAKTGSHRQLHSHEKTARKQQMKDNNNHSRKHIKQFILHFHFQLSAFSNMNFLLAVCSPLCERTVNKINPKRQILLHYCKTISQYEACLCLVDFLPWTIFSKYYRYQCHMQIQFGNLGMPCQKSSHHIW